jgi:hypothetical protein
MEHQTRRVTVYDLSQREPLTTVITYLKRT